jgi:hypothetical protein
MHRDDLAHNLPRRLPNLRIHEYRPLFANVQRTLFGLSNYRARTEIGADPAFAQVDWHTVKGSEYLMFETILQKVHFLADAGSLGRIEE